MSSEIKNESIKKAVFEKLGFGNLNILKLPTSTVSLSVESVEGLIDSVASLATRGLLRIPSNMVNDAIYYCPDCGGKFMAFFDQGGSTTADFCPVCSSRNIEAIDDE